MRRRASSAPRVRASRHGRHGREDRSPVVRPPLPAQETREERFDFIVGTAAEFLRSAWPELRDVAFALEQGATLAARGMALEIGEPFLRAPEPLARVADLVL